MDDQWCIPMTGRTPPYELENLWNINGTHQIIPTVGDHDPHQGGSQQQHGY